ncbi:MAG: hypothetical protein GY861_14875 [bacterium]|nr:hypothetical protein [bacterium]
MSNKIGYALLIILAIAIIYVLTLPQEEPAVVKENNYLSSIELGGEWFLNNQNKNFLHYTYYPENNTHSKGQHPLREMASMWSITQLAKFLDDEKHDELALRGFDHFEKYFVYDDENEFYLVNATRTIKLGYPAFAVLALIDMEHENKDYYLEKFADSIVFMQNDDGSLDCYYNSKKTGAQDYYPGEALIALMRLYEYNGNEKYLETVENAFPFYSEYWRENKNTAFVPWHSRAYNKAYYATNDEKYADFVFEMNDYMLDKYHPRDKCSNFSFSGSVTAVHMEGVNKAYELAAELDNERAECYKNFIQEAAEFTVSLQVTEDTDYEKAAVGGFMGSLRTTEMRVDRNQHAVMALMEAYELGILS